MKPKGKAKSKTKKLGPGMGGLFGKTSKKPEADMPPRKPLSSQKKRALSSKFI